MTVLSIVVSGDAEYDFGTPTNITDIEVRLDSYPVTVNLMDTFTPERVQRAGWIALGGITSVDGITTETYYWDPRWLNFLNNLENYPNGGYGPQYIRWSLKPGVAGTMRIST
jgi:hypothetical protein